MEFCALASGSSGNSFFIKNGKTSILIDAGISCKQIINRLSLINQSPEQINAIFLTHEHIDHIRGTDVLAKKFNIPIYLTRKTAGQGYICSRMDLVNPIKNNETIDINGLKIQAFSKSHEAFDPVSYSIHTKEKTLAIITDIGFACKNVIEYVSKANALILESNHDLDMLDKGPYPYNLKKWIASDIGHISNYHSAVLVMQHASKKLKHLVLSHLSINNNTPEIAIDTFKLIKERKDLNPKIHISTRYQPSDYITI